MKKSDKAITAEGISKKFSKKKVLDGITFTVDAGDLFGFLGPNGAGKTTTMRIILGLLEPTAGSAEVFGAPFGKEKSVRARTGVMLEGHGMYESMTLYKNIRYFAELYRVPNPEERVRQVIETVRLKRSSGEKVGNFSTGMKKKAALARALVNDPDILFLDEPTSGLDPEAQVEFREIVKELSESKGVTVFFNSHNLDEVQRICNKAAIISAGRILECDTIENLRFRYGNPSVGILLSSSEEAEKLAALLEADGKVKSCRRQGKRLECIESGESLKLKDLSVYNADIEEFSRNSRTLEDVYLEIVRKAEGEA